MTVKRFKNVKMRGGGFNKKPRIWWSAKQFEFDSTNLVLISSKTIEKPQNKLPPNH